MRKLIISLLFGLIFSMVVMAYADETQKDIASSVVRLHVVANSDSEEDQAVKLKVRDAIILELAPLLKDAKSPEHAKQIITDNLTTAEHVAQRTLVENDFDYTADAICGTSHFPTKQYENIILPPGNYDALKIILGRGSGQNWWCVMYPPLCFEGSSSGVLDSSGNETLKNNMSDDSYSIITDSTTLPVNFKFKILEVFDMICK